MKILFLSFYFPPFTAPGSVRAGKMAEYFHRRGHDVRVVTVNSIPLRPSLSTDLPEERCLRTPWLDVNAPYHLFRRDSGASASGPAFEGRGLLGRVASAGLAAYKKLVHFPDAQAGWLPWLLSRGGALIDSFQPDLLYASSSPPTSLLAAARLTRGRNLPWVAEYRDLWTASHYHDRPWPLSVLERRMEDRAVSTASGLVSVSDDLTRFLANRYGKPAVTVMNGFSREDYPDPAPEARAGPDTLRIVYTGIIYRNKRDPSPLFEAINLLDEDERSRVRVDFYGHRLPGLRELVENHGLNGQVSINQQVSHRESLRIQREADALLLLLWNTPEERGVYTSKLFEYLGARRPILQVGLERGAAADLIRERDVGAVSSDPTAIADLLREWLHRKREGGLPDLPEEKVADFSRESQFHVLEDFLEGLQG
ncbi:glycosyltransferase [Desulfohalovibrio reitneri]|uniref:glycosyltransferase n=1 Tax=Desulfohalovibrio reitneri TaxID=1307759 RepID=UPI0004A6B77C|nr:glycosyltransferase [Desulfohalovibrio reitneri]